MPGPSPSREKVQQYIDKYSGGKSPLTADSFIKMSEKYGVPIELMLAQGAAESNFGTKGRAVRTKNIFNVGNTTEGDAYPAGHPVNEKNSNYIADWEKGVETYAKLIRDNYLKGSSKEKLLEKFVNTKGQRYATDQKYETTLKSLMGDFSETNTNPETIKQEGLNFMTKERKPDENSLAAYELAQWQKPNTGTQPAENITSSQIKQPMATEFNRSASDLKSFNVKDNSLKDLIRGAVGKKPGDDITKDDIRQVAEENGFSAKATRKMLKGFNNLGDNEVYMSNDGKKFNTTKGGSPTENTGKGVGNADDFQVGDLFGTGRRINDLGALGSKILKNNQADQARQAEIEKQRSADQSGMPGYMPGNPTRGGINSGGGGGIAKIGGDFDFSYDRNITSPEKSRFEKLLEEHKYKNDNGRNWAPMPGTGNQPANTIYDDITSWTDKMKEYGIYGGTAGGAGNFASRAKWLSKLGPGARYLGRAGAISYGLGSIGQHISDGVNPNKDVDGGAILQDALMTGMLFAGSSGSKTPKEVVAKDAEAAKKTMNDMAANNQAVKGFASKAGGYIRGVYDNIKSKFSKKAPAQQQAQQPVGATGPKVQSTNTAGAKAENTSGIKMGPEGASPLYGPQVSPGWTPYGQTMTTPGGGGLGGINYNFSNLNRVQPQQFNYVKTPTAWGGKNPAESLRAAGDAWKQWLLNTQKSAKDWGNINRTKFQNASVDGDLLRQGGRIPMMRSGGSLRKFGPGGSLNQKYLNREETPSYMQGIKGSFNQKSFGAAEQGTVDNTKNNGDYGYSTGDPEALGKFPLGDVKEFGLDAVKYALPWLGAQAGNKAMKDAKKDIKFEPAQYSLGTVRSLQRANFGQSYREPQGNDLMSNTVGQKVGAMGQRMGEAGYEMQNSASKLTQMDAILNRKFQGDTMNSQLGSRTAMMNAQKNLQVGGMRAQINQEPWIATQHMMASDRAQGAFVNEDRNKNYAQNILRYSQDADERAAADQYFRTGQWPGNFRGGKSKWGA